MWTELTKDLVIREAILERGYEFEETEDHFYVIEYLRYVSCPDLIPFPTHLPRKLQFLTKINFHRRTYYHSSNSPRTSDGNVKTGSVRSDGSVSATEPAARQEAMATMKRGFTRESTLLIATEGGDIARG
jgi:hypothetical protein